MFLFLLFSLLCCASLEHASFVGKKGKKFTKGLKLQVVQPNVVADSEGCPGDIAGYREFTKQMHYLERGAFIEGLTPDQIRDKFNPLCAQFNNDKSIDFGDERARVGRCLWGVWMQHGKLVREEMRK